MRYLVVQYIKKPNGKMDEIVSVAKRLRPRDYQTSAVILDFKTQQVVLATMGGVNVPRDWWRIRDFYHQHYKTLVEDLEAFYGLKVVVDEDPVTNTSPDIASESTQSSGDAEYHAQLT